MEGEKGEEDDGRGYLSVFCFLKLHSFSFFSSFCHHNEVVFYQGVVYIDVVGNDGSIRTTLNESPDFLGVHLHDQSRQNVA